jgi:hypothetical protein
MIGAHPGGVKRVCLPFSDDLSDNEAPWATP